jgi:hypothetical protein
MNPALHAAIHSAAKAHKDLLSQFKDASAFSRETSLPSSQFGSEHKMMIDYYLKRDILKSSSGDRIYLNRRAYDDHKARMKTASIWVIVIFGLTSSIGILLLLAYKL